MNRSKSQFPHNIVLPLLLLGMLVVILVIFREYLFSHYAIFDDQRNVLKAVKEAGQSRTSTTFLTAPLFYLTFGLFGAIFSNVVAIKILGILIVLLFGFVSYKIALRTVPDIPYKNAIPALFTLMMTTFYLHFLMSGHQKSLALPVLLGAIYFTITQRRAMAFGLMFLVAFLYPPQFIIGIAFIMLYRLIGHLQKLRTDGQGVRLAGRVSRYLVGTVLPAVLIVGAYAGYFLIADGKGIDDTVVMSEKNIPVIEVSQVEPDIRQAIEDTRWDFIPSQEKLFGLVPMHYLNDIRMGMFGLMGGVQLWGVLILGLLGMVAVRRGRFLAPLYSRSLIATGLILYIFAFVVYNLLYFPNRYTLFTLPLAFTALFLFNLPGTAGRLSHVGTGLGRTWKWLLSLLLGVIAITVLYFGVLTKSLYFGEEYNRMELYLFLLVVLGGGLGILFLYFAETRKKLTDAITRPVLVFGGSVLFLGLIYIANPPATPINIDDERLVEHVADMDGEIELCGYPKIMDTINALSERSVRVNLSQSRTHADAFEFYFLLRAYYADDLRPVYEYMSAGGYDYFVVNRSYFEESNTESNNLFGFYHVLREYEERLKRGHRGEFVLASPPEAIVELRTDRHLVISRPALARYLEESA